MTVTLRDKIKTLAKFDEDLVTQKDDDYGSSWKKRGGVGAFMMLARKWDRIENFVRQYGYDVFAAIEAHPSLVEDMQDLGCYLWLVRSEGLIVEEVEVGPPDTLSPPGHRLKDLENPYAFVPEDDDPENDKPWSNLSRSVLPSVGDTELRMLYRVGEKNFYSLGSEDRIALVAQLRLHYSALRIGHEPSNDLHKIEAMFGVKLSVPSVPSVEIREYYAGRNSQPTQEETDEQEG